MTQPAVTIEKTKFLAREVEVYVEVGGVDVRVTGLDSTTITTEKTDATTDDFDTDGFMSHLPAMRGTTIALAGTGDIDPDTLEPLPGQAAVEALGQLVGREGIGKFKIVRPGGASIAYRCSVKCDPLAGGGVADASKWSAELKATGKPVYTPAPVEA